MDETGARSHRLLERNWRRYALGCLITAVIVLVDGAWLGLSSHSVKMASVLETLKIAGLLSCLAIGISALTRIPRYSFITKKLRCAEVSELAAWFALLVVFVHSLVVLSYLCVTVDAPLIESSLVWLDQKIGFDWENVYRWVRLHPTIHDVFSLAYASSMTQLIVISTFLGLTGRREDLSEFVLIVMISGVLVVAVSTPFPAQSAFLLFNVSDPGAMETVSDFAKLRDGTLRVFDISHAQGLVSMPSFHTVLAIFCAYAVRNVFILYPVGIIINLVVILSTPTQGGHYLLDLLAGALLAFASIQIVRLAFVLLEKPGIDRLGNPFGALEADS